MRQILDAADVGTAVFFLEIGSNAHDDRRFGAVRIRDDERGAENVEPALGALSRGVERFHVDHGVDVFHGPPTIKEKSRRNRLDFSWRKRRGWNPLAGLTLFLP